MKIRILGLTALVSSMGLCALVNAADVPAPADLVINDAKIYTADAKRSMAQALAVRAGKIVFVGSKSEAARWIGPQTKVESQSGRLVLPGLFDSHIHPSGIVDLDVCDLKSAAKSLQEMTAFVAEGVSGLLPPRGRQSTRM